MIFWIVAGALTALVVAGLLAPMLRARAGETARPAVAIYRDQLAELDRDRARGLIDEPSAAAARAEIGRRLLAAAAEPEAPAPARRSGRLVALVVAGLVPLLALAIYLPFGRPELPAAPLASRDPAIREAQAALVAEAAALSERLQSAPDDVEGRLQLGRMELQLGRPERAIAALADAQRLAPEDPRIMTAYAEALVEQAGGTVVGQAKSLFEQAVAAQPGDVGARYYLALAEEQEGDDPSALAKYQALITESPPNAPWLTSIRQRIAAIANRTGQDVAALTPEPGGAAMPDQAQIRAMVDGLAARLEAEPNDSQGWLMLGRSYLVLGEPANAVQALDRAASLWPEDVAIATARVEAMLERDGAAPAPDTLAALDALLTLDPNSPLALWFGGLKAAGEGRSEEAVALLRRLLEQMPPDTPAYQAVERQIEALAAGG